MYAWCYECQCEIREGELPPVHVSEAEKKRGPFGGGWITTQLREDHAHRNAEIRLAWARHRPPVAKLAERYGLSIATVNRILKGNRTTNHHAP